MKTKTTIITALLLLAMVSGAVAQEKWEYGVVVYNFSGLTAQKCFISTEINGKIEEKEVPKEQRNSFHPACDLTPVLTVINNLAKEGWEVFNVTDLAFQGTTQYQKNTFYLKRKLKD